ncbi:MAG TPA: alpha-hydroxy acid oxidase [Acidimicrobiales bacterium]|nr:alpha-hydroxy acid oxidase [Acidimicrobiales bacterium]
MPDRALARLRTVEDARELARRRLPRVVFDYIDGAAETEHTMRANRDAFGSVGFVPKMAVPGAPVTPALATSVLGADVSLPVILAPVGFTRAMAPSGDVAGATAAHAAKTIFTMSTMSGHSIEDVAAAAGGQGWFQLYGLGGRTGSEQLVRRARAAGFTALVVTVDTPIPGNRERDLRHGVALPLRFTKETARRFAPQALRRPRWLYNFARDGFSMDLPLSIGLGAPDAPMTSDEAFIHWVLSPITWDDFGWLREAFDGPVIAKGILSAADARRAVDAGCAAVVVSNHGGRQLDGVAASLHALSEVVAEVGDEVEVLVDGGVRRGSDVAKALCLGARAVLVGRAWAYGLGAAGEPGIGRVLQILRAELDRTLRLLGAASVHDLNASWVALDVS